MKSLSPVLAACFVVLIFTSSEVLAAPFGATTIGTSTYLQPCDERVDNVSTTVVVDTPSRLLVTISGAAVTPDPGQLRYKLPARILTATVNPTWLRQTFLATQCRC